ncbi:MAG TPA: 50S ribosomal protein L30 [Armatimonadota bacterium]|nr:50S ribosomal protein L30 [Armatimonadota bacterium]HOM71242.1 50S ribosomal protein L30 [Armatimonadota bacterium]HPP76147.1 50S ribosomal protein L30 [Armatimonadota bacterium]
MIKITLKRSVIGYDKTQRMTVKSLGLGRVGSSVVQEETPVILGMIRKIPHLLTVEQLEAPTEGKE